MRSPGRYDQAHPPISRTSGERWRRGPLVLRAPPSPRRDLQHSILTRGAALIGRRGTSQSMRKAPSRPPKAGLSAAVLPPRAPRPTGEGIARRDPVQRRVLPAGIRTRLVPHRGRTAPPSADRGRRRAALDHLPVLLSCAGTLGSCERRRSWRRRRRCFRAAPRALTPALVTADRRSPSQQPSPQVPAAAPSSSSAPLVDPPSTVARMLRPVAAPAAAPAVRLRASLMDVVALTSGRGGWIPCPAR
jgi:hypothetical protein